MRTLFLVALFSVCGPAFGQAKAVIKGPESVLAGDLCVLTAEPGMDNYHWILSGSNKTFLPVENGTKCIFSSGTPGEFRFILSVSKIEGVSNSTVDAVEFVVKVTGNIPGPQPPPDKPDPVKPDDPIPPDPGEQLTGISKAMYDTLIRINADRAVADKLSKNYSTIAGKSAGLGWDIRKTAEEFKKLNQDGLFESAEQSESWREVADVHKKLVENIKDVIEYREAYQQIAEGIDAYTNASATSILLSTPIMPYGAPSDYNKRPTLKDSVRQLGKNLDSISNEAATKVESTRRKIDSLLQEVGQ